MAIILTKGQKIDLTKTNPTLDKVYIGLGWDTNKYSGGAEFDLDVSVFMSDANGKVTRDRDFVFYNNLTDEAGSVTHSGDNRTGDDDGINKDDEIIKIVLSKIPADVAKISFVVTIFDAQARSQNFGMVANSFIRLVDEVTGTELMRYDLGEDFSVETAVVSGDLYRNGAEWKFHAIGAGHHGGLDVFCKEFGLMV